MSFGQGMLCNVYQFGNCHLHMAAPIMMRWVLSVVVGEGMKVILKGSVGWLGLRTQVKPLMINLCFSAASCEHGLLLPNLMVALCVAGVPLMSAAQTPPN